LKTLLILVIPDFTNKKPDVKSLAKFDRLVEPFMFRPGKRQFYLSSFFVDRSSMPLNSPPRYKKHRSVGSPGALRNSNYELEDERVEGLITDAELNAQQVTHSHLDIN
jgi:hypothetical protein